MTDEELEFWKDRATFYLLGRAAAGEFPMVEVPTRLEKFIDNFKRRNAASLQSSPTEGEK